MWCGKEICLFYFCTFVANAHAAFADSVHGDANDVNVYPFLFVDDHE